MVSVSPTALYGPTNHPLLAPDMKIYCMYGVGVPTERSYYYAVADEQLEEECTDHNSTGCTHEVNHEHSSPSSEDDLEAKSIKGPHLVSSQVYVQMYYWY